MKYIYPAVFYAESDGRYSVIFPDLNNLAAYGDSFADAASMAMDACEQYLSALLRDGEQLPVSSSIDAIAENEQDAAVNLVCIDIDNSLHNCSNYKSYAYTAVITELDRTFYAKVPDVPGCVTTADSLMNAVGLIADALSGCLAVLLDEGVAPAVPTQQPFIKRDRNDVLVVIKVNVHH